MWVQFYFPVKGLISIDFSYGNMCSIKDLIQVFMYYGIDLTSEGNSKDAWLCRASNWFSQQVE